MDKINASRITSSRSLKGATFPLAGWSLSHPKELPVLLECHTLTMNTIVLQLSDAVADISMLQCSAQVRILIINALFVADNATHALASSATAKPTFKVEDVVIRNGWTPKEKEKRDIYMYMYIYVCANGLRATLNRKIYSSHIVIVLLSLNGVRITIC